MAESKTGRSKGRPRMNPVAAMTAAERMRRSRALKREAAAQPSRPGNPGYTSQYSYYKRQALKNFAKFVDSSVANNKSVTETAARFNLSDSEWRHLRSGKRLRLFLHNYQQMLKDAEKAGWLTPRHFRVGNMTFLAYRPKHLSSPQEHREEQIKEFKEMDWNESDLDYMNTSSISDSSTGLFATLARSSVGCR